MAGTGMNTREQFEDYDGFVEKFKSKKTTDDCYTPENIYDAVADWTVETYGVNRADFVRPFFPGGDYEHFDYTGKIVVDNPPFSILAKIVQLYQIHGVRFLLFAPTLSSIRLSEYGCTFLAVGQQVIFENGANISVSFLTNLEDTGIQMRTVPELRKTLEAVNKVNVKRPKKQLPKYSFPPEVMTAARLYRLGTYGIRLAVHRNECMKISALDSQKSCKKALFGGGYLLSTQKAEEVRNVLDVQERERIARERERMTIWELSDREKEICQELNKHK